MLGRERGMMGRAIIPVLTVPEVMPAAVADRVSAIVSLMNPRTRLKRKGNVSSVA